MRVGVFGNGFEDMDCVLTSEGIFARSVGVGLIIRHNQGDEQSVIVRVSFIFIDGRAERLGREEEINALCTQGNSECLY